VPEGVAFGAGQFGGATAALGPGRLVLGVLLEGYAGPTSYIPAGLYLLFGYQLDVYRAPDKSQAPVVREPDSPPPPPVAAPLQARIQLVPPVGAPAASPAKLAPEPDEEDPTPEAPPPPPTERTTVATRIQIREQLFFGVKQVGLDPGMKAKVLRLARALQQLKQLRKLEVAGHADDGGDDARCLALSQQRAQAVVDALVLAGVPRSQLVAQGYGSTRPLVPLGSPARKREKNRRVDFSVLEMGAQ
jgi:outer membrane protein OmpA-like peptidoglycan-associated protein